MKIKNTWKLTDLVTGLTFRAIKGKKLDRLHIKINPKMNPLASNRDFFFTKTGEFDGTGSAIK